MRQHRFENREDWLNFRKGKIGASDAPIILGKSPYKTPLQLWREKLGLEKGYETDAMRRGIDMEKTALRAYCEYLDIIMEPTVVEHPLYDWMIASLDGADKSLNRIVEIKCPGPRDHGLAKQGKIPEHYQIQMQAQMAVTGLESADYWSFDGKEGVLITLKRDDDLIANQMIPALQEFYNCLATLIPPTGSDRDHIPMDSDEWITLARQYTSLREKIKELDAQADIIKEQLISMSNAQPAKGGGVTVSKSSMTSYDMKAIERDLGPLEKYKVKKEFLKLSIYKESND